MYLLDSNVFIDAKNLYYQFDTFPGFWDWLDSEQERGTLASIHPIRDELLKGDDELADWVKARKHTEWFQAIDDEQTQTNFAEIAEWVMAQPYKDTAKSHFLSGGDPWLIARARTIGATVVTHETYDGASRKKVKIPNVSRPFGVTPINTFELIRVTGAAFTLRGGGG